MLYLVLYSLCISNSHWLCGCLECRRNAGLGTQATCGMPTLTVKTAFDSAWNSLRHIFRSKELYKKYTQILYSCYLFWARCHHELVGAVFSCCWGGICTLQCAVLENCGANHLLSSLTGLTPACCLASLIFHNLYANWQHLKFVFTVMVGEQYHHGDGWDTEQFCIFGEVFKN